MDESLSCPNKKFKKSLKSAYQASLTLSWALYAQPHELSAIDYLQFIDENIEAQKHAHDHTATTWQDRISDTSSVTLGLQQLFSPI